MKAKSHQFPLHIQNAVVEVVENQSRHTYEFANGKWLFNDLLKITYDSPMAALCISKIRSFLLADGFADKKANDFQVNPKQKARELRKEIIRYESRFEGYAVVVRQDYPSMDITSVYATPIEKITRRVDGSYLVNPRRREQQGYMQSHDVHYYAYDPATPADQFKKQYFEQLQKYGKQIGRILYVFDPDAGDGEHYPVPTYYAADQDLRSDADYSRLDRFKVKNDFQASVVIATGVIDDTKETLPGDDPDKPTGESALDAFDKEINLFTAADPEKRSSILHLQAPSKDLFPVITPLNTMQASVDINQKRFGIQSNVARAFQVPGVLVGLYQPGSIGDTKKIADEISLFNDALTEKRDRIQRVFDTLWPDMDWTQTVHNPIDFIPAEVWAKMTDEEIRALGGLKPVEKKKATLRDKLNILSEKAQEVVIASLTEAEIRELADLDTADDDNLKESLNGEQITKLVEIAEKVKAGSISYQTGVEILKVSFGITRARAAKILGDDPATVAPPANPLLPTPSPN